MMQIQSPLPRHTLRESKGKYIVPDGYTSLVQIAQTMEILKEMPTAKASIIKRDPLSVAEEVLEHIIKSQDSLRGYSTKVIEETSYFEDWLDSKTVGRIEKNGITPWRIYTSLRHVFLSPFGITTSYSTVRKNLLGLLVTTQHPKAIIADALLGKQVNTKLLQGFYCPYFTKEALNINPQFPLVVNTYLNSLPFRYRTTQINLSGDHKLPTTNLTDTTEFLQNKFNELRETYRN